MAVNLLLLEANQGVTITLSGVTASVTGVGEATIKIKADGDINISFSQLTAEVKGTSFWSNNTATITIDSKRGDVSIFMSQLKAEVKGNGKATISIDAKRKINISFSKLTAEVKGKTVQLPSRSRPGWQYQYLILSIDSRSQGHGLLEQ